MSWLRCQWYPYSWNASLARGVGDGAVLHWFVHLDGHDSRGSDGEMAMEDGVQWAFMGQDWLHKWQRVQGRRFAAMFLLLLCFKLMWCGFAIWPGCYGWLDPVILFQCSLLSSCEAMLSACLAKLSELPATSSGFLGCFLLLSCDAIDCYWLCCWYRSVVLLGHCWALLFCATLVFFIALAVLKFTH
jgi:hypothetical protein